MTNRYSVVIQETHTYRLTVDAADVVGAMRAASAERAKGKGVRTSKTPWQAMPSVTRLPDAGSHEAVIGPVAGGKTFGWAPCSACGGMSNAEHRRECKGPLNVAEES